MLSDLVPERLAWLWMQAGLFPEGLAWLWMQAGLVPEEWEEE